jgi:hypothetical protein
MRCNDLHLLARQMGTSIAMIEQSTTDRSGRKRHVKNWQASMGISSPLAKPQCRQVMTESRITLFIEHAWRRWA